MSRVIVKGLPPYFDEAKLRSHFAHDGAYAVTDVKLMRKRSGESRRFGFVGFRSDDDAAAAVKYFNMSFIDTARISVEIAKSFGDENVPLSMKERQKRKRQMLEEKEQRLAAREARYQESKRARKHTIDDEINANPELKEYINALNDKRSWADNDHADGSGAPSAAEFERKMAEQEAETARIEENDSDNEYQDFGAKNQEDEEDEEMMIPLTNNDETNEDNVEEKVEDDGLARDENVSDLDWLIQRRKRMAEANNDENEEDKQTNDDDDNSKQQSKQQSKPVSKQPPVEPEPTPEDTIRATGRLFIRNILYTATEDDFRKLFEKFGDLEEVHVAVDTRTGKSKGFVYIQFSNPENAVKSFQALDKTIFQGRLLHILPAKAKKDHTLDEFDLKNMPLKKQRELKRKQSAAKQQFQWNSLYMSQDAVLESVAQKLGVSKRELLDPTSSSSAVKQALAEADVIGEVRRYFESHGVDLVSFETAKEKDDRIILVKNFPHGTSSSEIGELFAPYGAIDRILMPPQAATIAIVEFRDAPSARSAFSKLSYRKFKQGILYLEKGPKGIFTRAATDAEKQAAGAVSSEPVVEAKTTAEDAIETNEIDDDDDVVSGPTVSVFVKNLNFETTSAQLSAVFDGLPGFVVGVVKTKPNPKDTSKPLSMGYGFVEFRTKDQAETAIKTLDGYVLQGHRIQLKLSHRPGTQTDTNDETKSKSKKKGSAKIIIKNLPFEATRKDVVELLGAFGQLKSCRVPKKFDKSARGFAFVEFALAKEAEAAMDQLKGVHLLGRRLVMQYAEADSANPEEEIEKMMAKAQKQQGTRQLAEMRGMGKGKTQLEEDNDDELA
ncbi:hypothetical protein DIURU_000202 [Diutina rugosa]|uniref:Multiple RNA-binding domain-containing protein 1 n=1 Tax=Diutina rugosa TaxID=5481 RepID=A0A642V5R4_DIURU|nr:uncharacterized protein DIURU_000202 [Diutina rugosa]KAA8908413.1 hypothetical protein DIURU_000202 [Diutina rugosa]